MEGAAPPILAAVRSWFSPAVLFVLLNLVIGTIVVTSKGIIRSHCRHREEEGVDDHRRISRTTSSALERLRSIGGLYRSPSGEVPLEAAAPPPKHEAVPAEEHHLGRSKSEEHRGEGETLARRAAARSRSARSSRGIEGEEEEEVNAKADDFINRFRQQLKLQRLNSILRYKDMLNRGK